MIHFPNNVFDCARKAPMTACGRYEQLRYTKEGL
jgi:hypothetical protein